MRVLVSGALAGLVVAVSASQAGAVLYGISQARGSTSAVVAPSYWARFQPGNYTLQDSVYDSADTGIRYSDIHGREANAGTRTASVTQQGTTAAIPFGSTEPKAFFDWTGNATGSFTARSEYGSLHVRATGSAFINQSTQTAIYDAGGFAQSITHHNPFVMQGSGSAEASFREMVQINGGTPGETVMVRMVISLDASILQQGAGGFASASARFRLDGIDLLTVSGQPGEAGEYGQWTGEAIVPFIVGQTVSLDGYLNASASAIAYVESDRTAIPSSSASVDAGNTAHFYFEPIGPGYSVITGSGASYAIPVPEPVGAGSILLPAALLLRRRR